MAGGTPGLRRRRPGAQRQRQRRRPVLEVAELAAPARRRRRAARRLLGARGDRARRLGLRPPPRSHRAPRRVRLLESRHGRLPGEGAVLRRGGRRGPRDRGRRCATGSAECCPRSGSAKASDHVSCERRHPGGGIFTGRAYHRATPIGDASRPPRTPGPPRRAAALAAHAPPCGNGGRVGRGRPQPVGPTATGRVVPAPKRSGTSAPGAVRDRRSQATQ